MADGEGDCNASGMLKHEAMNYRLHFILRLIQSGPLKPLSLALGLLLFCLRDIVPVEQCLATDRGSIACLQVSALYGFDWLNAVL